MRAVVCGLAAFAVAGPAFAMRKCPAEFGEKNPLVNLTGWAVFGLAIVVGTLLMYYALTRSRGRPWGVRILVLLPVRWACWPRGLLAW